MSIIHIYTVTSEYFLRVCVCVCVCVCVSACMRACTQSFNHVQLFATLWTVAHQAPLSMEFSRQEYWSQLSFPTPEDLPWPRDWTHVSCISCIGRQILYHWASWKALFLKDICRKTLLIYLSTLCWNNAISSTQSISQHWHYCLFLLLYSSIASIKTSHLIILTKPNEYW